MYNTHIKNPGMHADCISQMTRLHAYRKRLACMHTIDVYISKRD